MKLVIALLVVAGCTAEERPEATEDSALTTLPTYDCPGPAPTHCVGRQPGAVTFALADAHLVDCADGTCVISTPTRLPAITQRELQEAGALSFTCGPGPCGGTELGILLPALGKPKRTK